MLLFYGISNVNDIVFHGFRNLVICLWKKVLKSFGDMFKRVYTNPKLNYCFVISIKTSYLTAFHIGRLWDMTSKSLIARGQFDINARSAAISPDGSQIAVGHGDGSFRVLKGR